jgi:hypothetical protein
VFFSLKKRSEYEPVVQLTKKGRWPSCLCLITSSSSLAGIIRPLHSHFVVNPNYGLAVFANCVGNLRPTVGARNQVGIGLSYRPASLCSLATQFQTRFLESIPRPIAGLKIPTLVH